VAPLAVIGRNAAAMWAGARIVYGRMPRVTLVLAALNVAAFLTAPTVTNAVGLPPLLIGGLATPLLLDAQSQAIVLLGQWYRLFTAMFLQMDPGHLLSNMVGLLIVGPFAELELGGAWMAAVYLAAGLSAQAAVFALGPCADAWGASAAIYGIAAALMARVILGHSTRILLPTRRGRLVLLLAGLAGVGYVLLPGTPGNDLAHAWGIGAGAVLGAAGNHPRVRLAGLLLVGIGSAALVAWRMAAFSCSV
jgi:membrane associated rhomboid family serine protease